MPPMPLQFHLRANGTCSKPLLFSGEVWADTLTFGGSLSLHDLKDPGAVPIAAEMRGGFRIWYEMLDEVIHLLDALLPNPDNLLADSDILKNGSRTCGGLVELAGQRYFLKRYNDRGWVYAAQYLLRRSRAVYTWSLARHFLARGVLVPLPLICLEERRCRVLGRSYVLMQAVDGACLHEFWPTTSQPLKMKVLAMLGRTIGHMHRQGFLHGDLKWNNIILRDGGASAVLVDLDGGRRLPWSSFWMARNDLERFLEDLRRAGGGSELERQLLQSWDEGWRGQG